MTHMLGEKMNKLFKYKMFGHLPGKVGRRYRQKYETRSVDKRFDVALLRVEGKTCIDLGANLGVYTRKMASVAKRVIAFEPDPWTHSVLQTNISDLVNVTIENVAASTKDGTVSLYRQARFEDDPARYSESSSIVVEKTDVTEERAIEVRQVDFIRYLDDLDEDIGLLKIDIEGAEVDLLEALFDRPDILKRIDYIFAETHETWIPDHEERVKALRERAMNIKLPRIDLYWH